MATYLHPGVYVEEITPGAPIQGVGTSTAAFIGVAGMGPADPTRITSWDAFRATFGEPLDETYAGGAHAWLGGSVKGFFENGGTACYVVRASSGTFARYELAGRGPAAAVIVATAKAEGAPGNSITISVADSDAINAASGADLAVARPAGKSTAVAAGAHAIVLTAAATFVKGDTITITGGGNSETRLLDDVVGDTLNFTLALANGYPANSDVTIADFAIGVRTLRLDPPAGGKSLRQLVSAGQSLVVDAGTPNAEFVVVDSVGTDSVTLRAGLSNAHPTAAAISVIGADFTLDIVDTASGAHESFTGVAMYAPHPRWFGAIDSALVTFSPGAAPPAAPDPRPVAPATIVTTAGTADDRAAGWASLIADPTDTLALLAPYDEVAIVAIPGATSTAAQLALVDHCEQLHDRVAIIDPPVGRTPTEVANVAPGLSSTDRGFGALYYPWLQIVDPVTKKVTFWPPSAHMAGVYARTDAAVGVWKAPANTSVMGALGLERRLTDADQDLLNPAGVNAFRLPPAGGAPRVWGARTTTASLNAAWMYISIRRLFNWLEESIGDGIRWAVFEPNDRRLWAKLDRTITAFLAQAQKDGAIFGSKPAEGFYVRIDDALNPPSELSLGRLYIEIGVRPVYPAEVIVVRIGIWDGGAAITEG
jgi:uncharacterized protein